MENMKYFLSPFFKNLTFSPASLTLPFVVLSQKTNPWGRCLFQNSVPDLDLSLYNLSAAAAAVEAVLMRKRMIRSAGGVSPIVLDSGTLTTSPTTALAERRDPPTLWSLLLTECPRTTLGVPIETETERVFLVVRVGWAMEELDPPQISWWRQSRTTKPSMKPTALAIQIPILSPIDTMDTQEEVDQGAGILDARVWGTVIRTGRHPAGHSPESTTARGGAVLPLLSQVLHHSLSQCLSQHWMRSKDWLVM